MKSLRSLRSRTLRASFAAGATAALFLALVACADAAPASREGDAAPSGAPSFAADDSGVVDYLEYTGGTEGPSDPSLEPVTIGYINQEGGTGDIAPNAVHGAELAVEYLNEELGGIGGHPVDLKVCTTSTAESDGQKCAQEMLSDDGIDVIEMGAVAVGADSFHATIDGAKPVVGSVSNTAAGGRSPNTYFLYGEVSSILLPWITYGAEVLEAQTAAIVYPEVAGLSDNARLMAAGAEEAGMDVKLVGFSPQATDLVAPLTASGAQNADVIYPLLDPKGCVSLSNSIDQLGIASPVASAPTCLDPSVAEALGGDLPAWTFGSAATMISAYGNPASVEAYLDVRERYGYTDYGADPFVQMSFGQTLTLARMMNELGVDAVTTETLAQKLAEFTGPVVMGPPSVECGVDPEVPAMCSDQIQFYDYVGSGDFRQASSWLGPLS